MAIANRPDAKTARVKKTLLAKGTVQTKFKVRCSRFLYTLVVDDVEKAEKAIKALKAHGQAALIAAESWPACNLPPSAMRRPITPAPSPGSRIIISPTAAFWTKASFCATATGSSICPP